jgi:hypothetical protein
LANPNNADGYRLSGSVYIPKRIGSSVAADGNALTVTGRAAYHGRADVPCITGNGSNVYVDLGSPLIPATADFEVSFVFKNPKALSMLLSQNIGNMGTSWVLYNADTTSLSFFCYSLGSILAVACSATENNFCIFRRIGNSFYLEVNGVGATSSLSVSLYQANTVLLANTNGLADFSSASISDLRITTGGVTTYFPLQDGAGTGSTNRNVAYIKSDGTGGVVNNAIVNGTVSTIWSNLVPGEVEDWCIKYGGRIAANGAFIPGHIAGNLCADGNAKTLAPGKFGNPFSQLNLNPALAAELNGRSVPTAATVVTNLNATITSSNSAFERTKTDGDDRVLIYDQTLSGADLSNVQGYIA